MHPSPASPLFRDHPVDRLGRATRSELDEPQPARHSPRARYDRETVIG